MIVGMAVETTVPSRAATARADMMPTAMTNCSGVIPMRRATAWCRRTGAATFGRAFAPAAGWSMSGLGMAVSLW